MGRAGCGGCFALAAMIVLVGALALAGCAEREAGRPGEPPNAAQEAARRAGDEARQAARDAGQAAREAARGAARSAGEAARGAARDVERAGENALLTAKVKNALLIIRDMDTSKLNVDTHDGDVVTLRGQVPTAAMKERAARIAAEVAGVRAVRNRLTVAPGRSPEAN